jgi:hypothetical protein
MLEAGARGLHNTRSLKRLPAEASDGCPDMKAQSKTSVEPMRLQGTTASYRSPAALTPVPLDSRGDPAQGAKNAGPRLPRDPGHERHDVGVARASLAKA